MLGNWRAHADYCKFAQDNLRLISLTNPDPLFEYETEISKLYILNLDKLKKIIAPLYSNTVRPSNFQPEIFRSFILMNHLDITLDEWIFKLKNILLYGLQLLLLKIMFHLQVAIMISSTD